MPAEIATLSFLPKDLAKKRLESEDIRRRSMV
jgi:hypothetical protein